jgi:hypothetical protein
MEIAQNEKHMKKQKREEYRGWLKRFLDWISKGAEKSANSSRFCST